ncbi:hypothetical protein D0859_15263 [Hortaea werneckii]|uniref:Cytochrome P450 n=1 Tax=Hortaea werneckii TaxID=91943 RepID=A0A3M7I5L5_HORWE|nr:hypothetical protein D0859_15263 [Hortaea werneckii]
MANNTYQLDLRDYLGLILFLASLLRKLFPHLVLRTHRLGPVMALLELNTATLLIYLLALAVHRLYLRPLAKAQIPGPKLGALTKFYEAYYEIVKRGRLAFKLDDLHGRYGEFGLSSRGAIIDQQSLVQEKCNTMLEGMTRLKYIGTVFKVTDAFAAFAGDVISQYSFGFSYGQVNNYETGWPQNFHDAYLSLGAFGHVALLKAIPERLVLRMDPSLGQMLQLQKDFIATIDDIKESAKSPEQKSPLRTMFHALLDSELPEYTKTTTRLEHEAQTVIGGGIVTTAWALTQSVFYILNDPAVYKRLTDELHQAIPDANSSDAFAYEKLERLPYLTGCVKEGIRFSYGISGRLPRVLHEPTQYREYTIPAGTAIAMSIRDVNFDEAIYDEPRNFKPERWTAVDRPATAADGSSLESHFVTFGKRARMCLGINLAYMELYIVLAQVFRRLVLELHRTDESDVELAHDFFLPSPKVDSKGVRVRVVEIQS